MSFDVDYAIDISGCCRQPLFSHYIISLLSFISPLALLIHFNIFAYYKHYIVYLFIDIIYYLLPLLICCHADFIWLPLRWGFSCLLMPAISIYLFTIITLSRWCHYAMAMPLCWLRHLMPLLEIDIATAIYAWWLHLIDLIIFSCFHLAFACLSFKPAMSCCWCRLFITLSGITPLPLPAIIAELMTLMLFIASWYLRHLFRRFHFAISYADAPLLILLFILILRWYHWAIFIIDYAITPLFSPLRLTISAYYAIDAIID